MNSDVDANNSGTALVLCALGLEYEAVRRYLSDLEAWVHRMGTRYEVGKIAGTPWTVAIAVTGQGNITTAALVERSLAALGPTVLIFSGVAGALKDDLRLGDVVVATRIDAYHGGKVAQEFQARPVTWATNHRLEQLARHVALRGTWTSLLPERDRNPPPVVHLSPVAAGEIVLANRTSELYRHLALHYNDAVAIEMESAGLASAAHLNEALPTLVVRGISDMADDGKSTADRTGSQHRAVAHAAAFTVAFLSSLDPAELSFSGGASTGDHWGMLRRAAPSCHELNTAGSRSLNFLPRDIMLMGRSRELEKIMDIPAESGSAHVLLIDAVAGMAGMGKTALAVHAAYLLIPQYSDAQFFIDLRGFTAGQPPLDPEEALGTLLRMLGVKPEAIPLGLDARSALWRSEITGMRSILILDNAIGPDQIAPLLPGTSKCRVLVTSRRRMSGLHNARSLSLACLDPKDAVRLLASIAGEERITVDGASAEEIVRLCGYLPLAIHITGSWMREHPGWSAMFFKEKLASSRSRVAAIRVEEVGLVATLDLSYSGLSDDCRMVFRRLGLHNGPIFSAESVAALCDIPSGEAEEHLETLYSHSLVEELADGRYRFHDLLRDYAMGMVSRLDSPQVRTNAVRQLLSFYIHVSSVADMLIDPYSRIVKASPDTFPQQALTGRGEALEWMERERLNILAAIRQAAHERLYEKLGQLADAAATFLIVRGYSINAIEIHEIAIEAAQEVRDSKYRVVAHENLGAALWEIGDFSRARSEFDQSLCCSREVHDSGSEARLLDRIGFTLERTGEYVAATRYLHDSLSIRRSLGDRHGEAKTLNSLGAVHWREKDYVAAMGCFNTALDIRREIADQYGEMRTLNNIGFTFARSGDFASADEYLKAALRQALDLGDLRLQCIVYNNLGYLRCSMGCYSEAREFSIRGLEISREAGSMYEEARSLDGLARSWAGDGCVTKAYALFGQALGMFERLKVPEYDEIRRRIQDIERER